jgi:diguanylate cyclase (GGDEF)-like protein/PAS domain S-box-containing protein
MYVKITKNNIWLQNISNQSGFSRKGRVGSFMRKDRQKGLIPKMEKITVDLLKKLPLPYAYHKIIWDDEGKAADFIYLDMNEAYEKEMKLQAHEVIGKRATEIFDFEKDDFDWLDFLGNVVLTGKTACTKRYFVSAERWFDVTAYSIKKDYFAVIHQDITEQEKYLQEVKRQSGEIEDLTRELEMIFNNTQDAMFLVKVEGDRFTYLRFNKVYEQYAEVDLQHTKGKTPIEAMGEALGKPILRDYRRCVKARKNITYEQTIEYKTGKKTWVISLTPIIIDNEVKYLVGSRMDITELKEARDENERLSQRLQTMFNEHDAIMLTFHPKTKEILDVNPSACDYYGYSRDELLNMKISDINERLTRKEQAGIKHDREKGKYKIYKSHLKNGETRIIDAYTCPITIGNEKQLFSIIFDSTDREKYKQELSSQKELLDITFASIGDGVVTVDNNGIIKRLNLAGQEITGWSEEEAIGRPFTDVFKLKNEETGEPIEDPISKVLKTGKIVGLANHTVMTHKKGHIVPIADSAVPIKDKSGRLYGVVMVFRDVSHEREHMDQILYLSFHDTLTGLYNRRFMEEEMRRIDVPRRLPISVIMGDVNGLKITNDVFGHQMGDKLLKSVSKTIKEVCRKDDIAARWGGDEFLIILPETNLDEAQTIVSRINSHVAKKKDGLQVSISFGCAVKENKSEDIERVLQKAEENMYHQKLLEGKSYRNSIVNALLGTLYEKSSETKEHSDRLKRYCHIIGRAMKLPEEDMSDLELLAVLHDIGKVAINRDILQKPGSLTKEEWIEIKRHPEIGYRIALNTPELSVVADYILSHHERWDGQGYPRGIKGDKIPLLCRILSVADAYDAMTSGRVYRKAMSHWEAVCELEKCAGTQFDKEIVDIFIRELSKGSGKSMHI